MRQVKKAAVLTVVIIVLIAIISGCSQGNTTEPAFEIPVPTAPGISVESNEMAMIDYSNIQDGYVIVKFIGVSDKRLKVVVEAPHNAQYVYALSNEGIVDVIPLTEGNGEYKISVYENIDGDEFSLVLSSSVNVVLKGEFEPFLRPNQFVNYSKDSHLVELAAELTKDADNAKEKIIAIYDFVVENFTYDYELAANVQSGYLPNLDEVLQRKVGICFDYSALVTAMLRSQGIPARLEIGYHGDEYHAWISLFCENNGWIDKKYYYDRSEEEWMAMDPTLESAVEELHLSRQQARDDVNYRLMYNY